MSACLRCGASFSCAMEDDKGNATCWCMLLPPLSEEQLQAFNQGQNRSACLCPICLKSLTDAAHEAPLR